MKSFISFFGKIAFNLGYPLFAWHLSRSERTRVIVRCDNQVLLVKSWLSLGGWDLPGGGLHKSEPPVVGGLRELAEEVGVMVDERQVTMIGELTFESGKIKHQAHYMTVQLAQRPSLTLQRREIAEAQWVTLEQLDQVELHKLHKQQIRTVLTTEV